MFTQLGQILDVFERVVSVFLAHILNNDPDVINNGFNRRSQCSFLLRLNNAGEMKGLL